MQELKYDNEFGSFSEDGREYIIKINKHNRLPTVWSHVLSNPHFGTILTETMGGYTYSKNSRLNRLTAWSNRPVTDPPSEIFYLKDENLDAMWSLGANPSPDNEDYHIIYGFGYAKYLHTSNEIAQELEVFVPQEDNVKVNILTLRNQGLNKRSLKLYYYIKPVLAEDETKSNGYINLEFNRENNLISFTNLYNTDFKNNIGYISSTEKICSYTGDKDSFLGNGGITFPDGINHHLNDENSLGCNSCIVMELEIILEPLSEKQIVFMLGCEENLIEVKDKAYKYSKIQNVNQELINVKRYWEELLSTVVVKTQVESMDLILNGWVAYQTITSRLWARSGYYQSGGAIGFRDQLQDTLGLKFLSPEYMKTQILKHARHQFIEGDVEHWWHEETKRGIRTRFSDDLLWMCYVTYEYIDMTGDMNILKEQVPYITGNLLEEGKDEDYDVHPEGDFYEDIYNHCIRAIEKSSDFGPNGLPKIGSGDWNDGMSEVGNKGIGESVWLGFFLYDILDKFVLLIQKRINKIEEKGADEITHEEQNEIKVEKQRLEKYKKAGEDLRKALNSSGWDGRWFKRAFTDHGDTLRYYGE